LFCCFGSVFVGKENELVKKLNLFNEENKCLFLEGLNLWGIVIIKMKNFKHIFTVRPSILGLGAVFAQERKSLPFE
jgi:hypothetical protein